MSSHSLHWHRDKVRGVIALVAWFLLSLLRLAECWMSISCGPPSLYSPEGAGCLLSPSVEAGLTELHHKHRHLKRGQDQQHLCGDKDRLLNHYAQTHSAQGFWEYSSKHIIQIGTTTKKQVLRDQVSTKSNGQPAAQLHNMRFKWS